MEEWFDEHGQRHYIKDGREYVEVEAHAEVSLDIDYIEETQ